MSGKVETATEEREVLVKKECRVLWNQLVSMHHKGCLQGDRVIEGRPRKLHFVSKLNSESSRDGTTRPELALTTISSATDAHWHATDITKLS